MNIFSPYFPKVILIFLRAPLSYRLGVVLFIFLFQFKEILGSEPLNQITVYEFDSLRVQGLPSKERVRKEETSLVKRCPKSVGVKGTCSDILMTLFKKPILSNDLSLAPYGNTLIGGQVFLRPVFPEDYVSFLPMYTSSKAMKYYKDGRVYSPEEIKEFAQRDAYWNKEVNLKNNFTWSIITSQGIAGVVGLIRSNPDHIKGKGLFYCISPTFSGKNITTTASQLVLESTKGPFYATVHPKNLASHRVLEKLGFTRDFSRQGVPKFGSIRDYYVLNVDEFITTSHKH